MIDSLLWWLAHAPEWQLKLLTIFCIALAVGIAILPVNKKYKKSR